MVLTRKYHDQLLRAAAYYESQANNLNPGPDPAYLADATHDERKAHGLRVRAATLRHHVDTCPHTFHLVPR